MNELFIAAIGCAALIALMTGYAVMRKRKCRGPENRRLLAGRWRVEDCDREIVFGKGSAGYCEAGGRIDTFAFVVRGDRLAVSQDCVVKRYRIVRIGEERLRLEGESDTLVLKRQTQNRP